MISVIVPIYNGEAFIERCLRSILNNTYRDLELLVVANACRDNTVGICRNVAREDGRVRVIETDVPGVSHARNLGIESAAGEYLMFVDGDDYVSPVMLEHLLDCATTEGRDMVPARCRQGTEWLYEFPVTEGKRRAYTTDEYLSATFLLPDMDFTISCNRLIRRSVLGGLRFDETLRMAEDTNLIAKIACRAGGIGLLDEELYYYWHGAGTSATDSQDAHMRMDILYALLDDVTYMQTQYPDHPVYSEYAACSLLQHADRRVRNARRNGYKDIKAEARGIAKQAAGIVRKSRHLPKRAKFRLLFEHDARWLYRIVMAVWSARRFLIK